MTSTRDRVAYYLTVASAIVMGGFAGMVLIADHPELDGLDIRLVAATFFAMLAWISVVAARESWCRMHGFAPLAIEHGWVEERDSE